MRWLLVLLAACGDNHVPTQPYEARSGTRVELRIFQYSDGTRQWDPTVFFDRELDERCTVQRWGDGYTYCTPTVRSTVYSEPTCTSGELGRWLATQPPPDFFYRESTVIGNDVISRVFRRSDAATPPATTYELVHGNCVETAPLGWNYFQLGEELTSDDFARIKLVNGEEPGRLAFDVYTSDDGLYVPVWSERPLLRDRELDEPCVVLEQPNSPVTRCEPVLVGKAEFSRDAACRPTDILVVEASMDIPEVVAVDDRGCRAFARRGPEIANRPLFLPLGPSCVSVNPPTDAHLFEVGARFDVPVLSRVHEPTDRRLQRIFLTDGTTTVVDSLLFDRELGVDCTRTLVGPTYRCIPATSLAQVQPYFRDEQCTQPIEISLVEVGPCDSATRFAVDFRGAEPAVRPLVAAYGDKLYEISTSETCLEYIPSGRQKAFTVGATIPPFMFVDAQVLVE